MSLKGLFHDTISALERSLNLRSRNHQLIASNVANLDTPNYKAFKMVMDEVTDTHCPSLSLEKTHSGHLVSRARGEDRYTVETVDEEPSLMRGDGNTVNLDREMSNLAENTLLFNAGIRMTSKQFKLITDAIKGN